MRRPRHRARQIAAAPLFAAEAGAGERLHILPPAPPSEMERLAADYDIGFVGETGHTANRQIALTNKLFSYLLAGLPCVMSDIPAHRQISHEVDAVASLFTPDDPEALSNALDRFLLDSAKFAAARRSAFELGQRRFNWDVEKRQLIDLARHAAAGDSSCHAIAAQ
jgi:glycosyltransferase involved in cell wall biosynthesis